jgi:hypothetical protein
MTDRRDAGAELPDAAAREVEEAAVREAQQALAAALRRLWAVELPGETGRGG